MNSILSMLLPSPAGTSASPASTASAQTSASSASEAGSTAQFKSQFDRAVAALAGAAPSTSASTASAGATQGTSASSAAPTASAADTLTVALQKKIADLLAKGETVAEIVQQLAASLASSLAAQFGGNPAQIQDQLQTAFVSALSPPTTGPPLSATDLASALAQRFRQVADLAAGVIGETGQSNRLFAGSISDAATTAGVQPAPQGPSGASPNPADSTATTASALFATLTASPGDGKTVATNGAPALGPNGDTLLGRILARAAQPSPSAPAAPQPQDAAPPTPTGTGTTGLTALALAAATAALGNATPATTDPTPATTLATGTPAAIASRTLAELASTTAENSGSSTAAAPLEATPANAAVSAFVKLFTDALASPSAPVGTLKTNDDGNSTGTLLQTTVSSSQAPTIGAFAPVAPVLSSDATVANGAQGPTPPPPQTAVAPDSVVEQVLRGAFLNTVGSISTVRLRLVPETLGDISVKLTVNGSSVDAQVMAQTPAAHDALVAGQGLLTRALADAGLKLTSFNVDLAGGFSSFQQQQQQSSQQSPSNGRSLLLGGVDTPETDENALLAVPTGGPPILAGANWNALNYLA